MRDLERNRERYAETDKNRRRDKVRKTERERERQKKKQIDKTEINIEGVIWLEWVGEAEIQIEAESKRHIA